MTDTTIRCFLSVCGTLNITSAADLMHMTQQAVSKQILSLEKEIGYPLFIRGLFQQWQEEWRDASNTALRLAKGETNAIRIAYLKRLKLPDELYQVISNFKKSYPETMIQYSQTAGNSMVQALLDDELDFDVSDFNRQIILPDHTYKVLREISNYLNPESAEKTLIFAVNDAHADRIVDTLREIYAPYGVSSEAILKITGKTAGGNKKKILQVIKKFKNDQYPNIAVTVDLLSTGIDVERICNLVFMRKINSRILFEQMLGRATRLCPEIGKTHFNIFDAARVYEDLDDTSGMKSVSVSKTMEELLEDLFRPSEGSKQQIKDRILAKLQRKNNHLTEQQKYEISEYLGGSSLKDYVKELKSLEDDSFISRCQQDKVFFFGLLA